MKITFEVDASDKQDLSTAATMLIALGGQVKLSDVTGMTNAPDPETDADEAEAAKKAAAAAKRKEAREKKKAEEAAAAKKAEEAKAAEEASEDDDLDDLDDDGLDDDAPTREDVRAKLKEVQSVKGKPAAVKILKDHGASSMSELKDGDFASAIAAAEEALDG